MRFAHMKRIHRLDRLRLRGLSGAKDEVLLSATAQNLRRLASSSADPRLVPPLHVQRRYQVASGVGDDASTTPLCRRAE